MALRSRTSAQVNTLGFKLSHSQDIFMATYKCNWLWKTCQAAVQQFFSFHVIVLRNSTMIHLWTTMNTSLHIRSDLLPLSANFYIAEEPFL